MIGPVAGRPTEAQQKIADQLEQASVWRYRSVRPARVPETFVSIVVSALRAADSRMRLELALARLSRVRTHE